MTFRHFFCAATVFGICSTPIAAQKSSLLDPDHRFEQTDRHIAAPERVREICTAGAHDDYSTLLHKQVALVDAARRKGATASDWIDLACSRALLFALRAPARSDALMLQGIPWVNAAVDHLIIALNLEPANLRAARLLSVMAFEVIPRVMPAANERELIDITNRGVVVPPAITLQTGGLLYRAITLGVKDPSVFRACTSLMFDAGDAGTGHDCSIRALMQGSDSSWHLLRLTWLAVLQADTASAKTFFWLALVSAHDSIARADVGWHLETPCHTADRCEPTGIFDLKLTAPEKEEWLVGSDSAAATWFSNHFAVSVRGDTGGFWRGKYGGITPASVMHLEHDQSDIVRHLVAHFAGVAYAGGTFRACMGVNTPPMACWSTLNPYGRPAITIVANMSHLWNPKTGAPIDLVPYALTGNDLIARKIDGKRRAAVLLDLHQWGGAAPRDTLVSLDLLMPSSSAKRPVYTGFIELPGEEALTSWSMMATQFELRHGGVYQESKAPLDRGPLALSDLVLGVASEQVSWNSLGKPITLAPQGGMLRNELVHLYYQVRSEGARDSVQTRITIFPQDAERATSTPALQIGYSGSLSAGINEVQRDIDLSTARIPAGKYWFQMEVTDLVDHTVSRRAIVIFLQ